MSLCPEDMSGLHQRPPCLILSASHPGDICIYLLARNTRLLLTCLSAERN